MSQLVVFHYHFGPLSFAAIFALFICRGHCCGSPPGIEDGKFVPSKSTYRENENVTYICNSGFKLNGDIINTCRGYNKWTRPAPICKPEPAKLSTSNGCGTPGTPRNGKSDFNSGTPQTKIKYTCSQGHILIGSDTRTCEQRNGSWIPNIPKCVPNLAYKKPTKQSSPFPINYLVDGNASTCNVVSKNLYGAVTWVLVELDRPYNISHITVVIPKNTRIALKVTMTNSSKFISTGKSLPPNLPVFCDMGTFTVIPPPSCNHNGTASVFIIQSTNHSLNICDIQIFNIAAQTDCETPDMPLYGNGKSNNVPSKKRFDYTCQNGYRLNGHNFTECINGQWNHPPPLCLSPVTTKSPVFPTKSPTTTKKTYPSQPSPTPPRTTKTSTTSTTTPKSEKDHDNTAVVGIMGIAIGAVAASLAIIVAVVVVVCIMKKYYKRPQKYPGDYGTRVSRQDDYSATYNRSNEGSQHSSGYRENSVHLYDSIKDPRLPYTRSPELTETVLNQSYGITYSPYNPVRKYQQLLPQLPPSRIPPLYDTVTEDEISPINAPLADPEANYIDDDGSSVRVDSLYIAGAPRTAL